MGTGESALNRWDSTAYQRIVQVEGQPTGQLAVRFADDSTARLDGRRVVPPGVKDTCWDQAHAGEHGFDIFIPRQNGTEIDVPRDVIRKRTDREFAAYMNQSAAEPAHVIGRKLRSLRQARGYSVRELAARTGVTPQRVYRLEQGKHDIVLPTLGKLLAAMGCTYQDLVSAVSDEEAAAMAQSR